MARFDVLRILTGSVLLILIVIALRFIAFPYGIRTFPVNFKYVRATAFLVPLLFVLLLYRWQQARKFEEFVMVKRKLKLKVEKQVCLWASCGCVWILLSALGYLCSCLWELIFFLVEAFCIPINACMGSLCPSCWAKYRRGLEHSKGTCWYVSERVAYKLGKEIDDSPGGGSPKSPNVVQKATQLIKQPSPDELKERARQLFRGWGTPNKLGPEPERDEVLSEAVEILEEARMYSDSKCFIYTSLLALVVEEVVPRLGHAAREPADFDAESATFVERKSVFYGKHDAFGVDHAFFEGAGAMERMGQLIQHLDRIGIPVTHRDLDPVHSDLIDAGVRRLQWALAKQNANYKHVQYALFCANTLDVKKGRLFEDAAAKYKRMRDLPDDWDVVQMIIDQSTGHKMCTRKAVGGTFSMIKSIMPSSVNFMRVMQTLLDETFKSKYTRDRKGGQLPQRLVVVFVRAIQNESNFLEYVKRRKEIADELQDFPLDAEHKFKPRTMDSSAVAQLPELDPNVQEAWLFHGTSKAGADGITGGDFQIDRAGTGAGTLYGRGIYLAEACTKSDEYTVEEGGERFLLLCRTVLGRVHYTDEVRPDTEKLEQACLSGTYHSVLGDREKSRGTYREFMVYDDDQVYPAYMIAYRRQYYSKAARATAKE
eukprot:TRINITY_DN30287_c0_g1_i1.p1 TRINITY_DN30287_c0_g1~~TRINITY_DN30287_c0_g1_i1.p1  ORF type:complete len:684 (-),score=101.59 TRINITY_DN30287_c0_g1_i1:194-2155(-)